MSSITSISNFCIASRGVLSLSKTLLIGIGLLGRASGESFFCSKTPGEHIRDISPVYGSRHHEFEQLYDSPFRHIFSNAAAHLYQNFPFRAPFKKEELERCSKHSDELYQEYLAKYAPYNCSERNMIRIAPLTLERDPWSEKVHDISERRVQWPGGKAIVTVADHDLCRDECCVPKGLVKKHEIMHVEEFPYASDSNYLDELLTSLQGHIDAETVYQKCHIPEVDDKERVLMIGNQVFPAKELADFYQELAKEYGSLSAALVSPKSVAYLIGDFQYEAIIDLIQKEPGSEKAVEIAHSCLSNPDWKVQLLALPVVKHFIQTEEYPLAFKLIEKALRSQDGRALKAYIEEAKTFIRIDSHTEEILEFIHTTFKSCVSPYQKDAAYQLVVALHEKQKSWDLCLWRIWYAFWDLSNICTY